jgi:hypothetical protein
MRACEISQWKNWIFLDTLAAAYAEAGDFAKATEYQQMAIDTSPQSAQDELQQHLDSYQQSQPLRVSDLPTH